MEKGTLCVTAVSLYQAVLSMAWYLCGGGAHVSLLKMRDTLGNRIRIIKLTNGSY